MITGAEGIGNREVGRGLSDGFAAVCPPARVRLAGGGRGLRARRGHLRAERQEQEEHEPVGQDNEKNGTHPPPPASVEGHTQAEVDHVLLPAGGRRPPPPLVSVPYPAGPVIPHPPQPPAPAPPTAIT